MALCVKDPSSISQRYPHLDASPSCCHWHDKKQHNQRLKTGNLTLDDVDAARVANSAEAWEKVIVKLRSRATEIEFTVSAGAPHREPG